MEYAVYNKDGKWLASYGIGWSLGTVFRGTDDAAYVVLRHKWGKEIIRFDRDDLKKV